MKPFKPQGVGPVLRISLPYLAGVIAALESIDNLAEGQELLNIWTPAYGAQQQVNELYNGSVYSGALRSSRKVAEELVGALRSVTEGRNFDYKLTTFDVFQIKSKRDRFRIAFLAELEVIPTYFVSQKNPFDTATLLENGLGLFPVSLSIKVPESVFDAMEMSKAVAFELPTASGFHMFRVLEAVLRRYHADATGGSAPPKVRTIGTYVRSLRTAGKGDPAVLATLDQIRDLHRNPLIHPELAINMEQAISLYGVVRSAVSQMLDVLPVPPLTTITAAP